LGYLADLGLWNSYLAKSGLWNGYLLLPCSAVVLSPFRVQVGHLFQTLSSMVCWHISNRTQRDGSINIPSRIRDSEIRKYTGISVPKRNRLCNPITGQESCFPRHQSSEVVLASMYSSSPITVTFTIHSGRPRMFIDMPTDHRMPNRYRVSSLAA